MIEVERVVSIARPGAKAAEAKNDDPLAVRDILRTGLKSQATMRLNEHPTPRPTLSLYGRVTLSLP